MSIHVRRKLLLTATVLVCSTGPGLAFAQAERTGARATPDGALVDEVVVSARRREERLQDVPMSVTSLSAATLDKRGVVDIHDMEEVTPGLRFSSAGVVSQPSIRGVATTSGQIGDEANVAIYVDGIYSPAMSFNLFSLNNVERVEVLRGPQGTLFGRNAAGGAISITSRAPSEDRHGEAVVGYGNFEQLVGGLYVTGGWANGIASDLAIYSVNDGGYVDDLAHPGEKFAKTRELEVRTRTDGDFDSWRFSAIAGYAHSNTTTILSGQSLNGNGIGRFLPAGVRPPYSDEPWRTTRNSNPLNPEWRYYGSLKVSRDVGDLTLTSQTTGSKGKQLAWTDTDSAGGPLTGNEALSNLKAETYTQEFQLAPTAAERLVWVAGVYLINFNAGNQPVETLLTRTQIYTKVATHGAAAFGEATYDLTDRLSVTAGLRYSYEEKHNFGYRTSAAGVRSAPTDVTAHWGGWTPRVIVRYIVPDAVNLYGSYSEGFKSGLFNSSGLSGIPVDPERLNAYEIGVKTLGSDRYRATLAAYHYDYNDIQVSVRTSGSVSVLQNAASAKINGGEFTFDARLSADWTASFNTAYIHGRYASFPGAVALVPLAIKSATAVNAQPTVDASGNTTVRTPEWTLGASLEFRHEYDFGGISATGNVYWVDKQYFDATNRLSDPAHTMVNAQVSWSPPGQRYRFTLWGSNLLNEAAAITINPSPVSDTIVYARPRSFGAKAQVSF